MAIIKNLAFCSKDILKKLDFVKFELSNSNFVPFPVDLIHSVLPLKFKFLRETFLVMDEGKVYGLITLEKDDTNNKRLKITQFFLAENALSYGELLINYVVNKFMGQGAESFYISVDEDDAKLIKLLCDDCKFRIVSDEYLFKVKKSDFSYDKINSFSFIRFTKNSETKQIAELYNSMIYSHQLPVFEMEEKYFKDNIFVGLTNKITFKYALENDDKKHVFGYFTISTRNNKDFVLDVALQAGFEVYLADILKFSKYEVTKRSSKWTLYIRIKSCFMNHKEFLDTMSTYNIQSAKKSKVLVKDMFREVKADNLLSGKQIIFNDITPAY